MSNTDPQQEHTDLSAVQRLRDARDRIKKEIGNIIIGQERVVEQLLVAIFAQGHCILEGVPGLAKTLMVDSLAKTLDLHFRRIQFTPDLMPSDITGTEVIQEDRATGHRSFKFMQGPVFTNILLADEINRTPPKTQAALLEAMQEKQVSAGGDRHPLPSPFFVLATQNPIEQEGTYPLPEAQQDRFMFKILVGYPSETEEYTIAERTTAVFDPRLEPIFNGNELKDIQQLVRRVPVPPNVIWYAVNLVRATRIHEDYAADFVKEFVSWGAGPRAVQYLLLGAKTVAALDGRSAATVDDIKHIAHPVLRHRILTNFHAESEGVTADQIVDRLLAHTDAQKQKDIAPEEVRDALQTA
jgi:MoxR-like ATPase